MVVDSRSTGKGVKRRRRCTKCKKVFGTQEQAEVKALALGPDGTAALDQHLRAANLRMVQLQEELKMIRSLIRKG